MDWGMRNRLSRVIKADGRTVMLAVDHGYFMGPTRCLERPAETVRPLAEYADALMPTRGVVRSCLEPSLDLPLVLRVSGGTSMDRRVLSDETLITSMEDAVRINASAVAISVFVGTDHERRSLKNMARLVDEGYGVGVPVLAVTAVGEELEKRNSRYLGLACRISAELGAQFVKTYYCENFSEVAENCPVPLVIAGGPKMKTELDVFKVAAAAISEGAAGVDMGRNIWQNEHPVAMIRGVRAVVHDDATPEQAHEIFLSSKNKKKVLVSD